jgi:hypothetical protein
MKNAAGKQSRKTSDLAQRQGEDCSIRTPQGEKHPALNEKRRLESEVHQTESGVRPRKITKWISALRSENQKTDWRPSLSGSENGKQTRKSSA